MPAEMRVAPTRPRGDLGPLRAPAPLADGPAWGAATPPVGLSGAGLRLGVSDLLLALEDGGPVSRGGIGIVPASRAVFAGGAPVGVYLEAHGLGLEDGRTRHTVEAVLRLAARRGGLVGRLLGRGRAPSVSVCTEGSGTAADEPLAFLIDVRDETTGRAVSAESEVTSE